MKIQPYLHIFGPISSILFGLSVDALSTIAFCVDYPVHLSIEGTSVVKTDSEGWAVFLGRRIVLPFLEVSSPDCNQNRTGLVRAGKQRMRVVAGSEGATDESTPDCSCSVDLKPADYASKATDRRSVSGGVIMCGGASVCWFSRTQKCVTLSTSEAEYVALGDAVKELLFLRQVWRFMLPSKVMPCFPVFEDNQGAVQLAENPITNSNTKHIDVRHHFLRELVRQRDIKVVQVPSKFQHADILTKALAFDLFAFHRKFLLNLK